MKLFAILVFILCVSSLNANEYVQTNRYVEIDISPQSYEVDPLQVVIDFSFPSNINTIGEAIHLLISPSGYRLDVKENDIAYLMFEMPLPEVHKHLGPIRFKEAVSVLSGKGFIPKFDESLRRISFTTNSESINSTDVTEFKKSWENRGSELTPILLSNHDNNYTRYTTEKGDSISKIAAKLGLLFDDDFLDIVVGDNPHAFINQDPNLLMSGVTIKVSLL